MNKIKAVIFDMDGVLIDARDWHYESLNKALDLFGLEISKYDHLISYDGLPTKKKLEMLSREQGLPTALHGFINTMKQQYTTEMVFQHCRPNFSHQYALAKLQQNGYRMAVCSNSIRATIEVMMKKSALVEYLDFWLSNQDVERAKPNPEIYYKAINKLGLDSQDCLIVEDNAHGIEAARSSGAHVLEVSGVQDVNYTNIIGRIQELES